MVSRNNSFHIKCCLGIINSEFRSDNLNFTKVHQLQYSMRNHKWNLDTPHQKAMCISLSWCCFRFVQRLRWFRHRSLLIVPPEGVWNFGGTRRVQEPYMGFARIFQRIPRLIRRRPNFVFQMQDFESYKRSKNQSARNIFQKIFSKRIQKECAGSHWITFWRRIDQNWYCSSTQKNSRLFTWYHAFLQKQRFAKTRLMLEFLEP